MQFLFKKLARASSVVDKRSYLYLATILGLLVGLHVYRPHQAGLWLNSFFEAMHIPVFAVVGASVYLILRKMTHFRYRIWVSVLVCGVLGALSEAAQIAGPRDASIKDFVVDVTAAGAGMLLVAGIVDRSRRRLSFILLAAALLLPALVPLAQTSVAVVYRNHQVPVLFRPNAPAAHLFYKLQNSSATVVEAPPLTAPVLMLRFGPGPWPGIMIHDLWENWTAYTALRLEVYNPLPEALHLNLRIDDKAHRNSQQYSDRYNTSRRLSPGLQVFEIPLEEIATGPADRRLNLAEIDRIILFVDASAENRMAGLVSIGLQ